jgi:hypothetical protein
MVDSDGSTYVEYEVRQLDSRGATSASSILWLLKIAPDGTTSTTQLSASNNANLFPGNIIPDGQGGVLATWTVDVPFGPPGPHLYQAADVFPGGGLNHYDLPMAPMQLVVDANTGLPVNPPLVLGENGTAFVSYGTNVTSFDLNSGSVNWNHQTPSQSSTSSLSAAISGSGPAINGTQQGLILLDSSGNAAAPIPGVQAATPYTLGRWSGLSNGVHAMVAGPRVDLTLFWPTPNGGRAATNASDALVVSTFVPPDKVFLGLSSRDAEDQIEQLLPKSVKPEPFLGSEANISNFTNELAKPIKAFGFMGHSAVELASDRSNFSVGLILADHPLQASTDLSEPPYIITQYTPDAVQVKRIDTQAKVVFMAACDIGPVFEKLWNITNGTTGQVLVVPVGDETQVRGGHAVAYWGQLLYELIVNHENAGVAINTANKLLLARKVDLDKNPITEQWQPIPIGAANVKIN